MRSFNETLGTLLKQLGVTNYKLAKNIGVSQSTVKNWIDGTTYPDVQKLIEISQFLNVSADYLLGLSDDPKQRDLTPAEREALQKAAADIKGYETTDEELAAKLPADIREGILALIRLERDKHNNN